MNAKPIIDMKEVTRLTRDGRLAEAMALLRGEPAERGEGEARQSLAASKHSAVESAEAARTLDWRGKTAALRARKIRSDPSSAPIPAGAAFEEHAFSNSAGARTYKLYVPSAYARRSVPLVVMLHGCTQSPDDFAAATRMNELAEEQCFLVAYPAQTKAANASKCWNWFNAADQRRGRGEPSLIAGITRQIMRDFNVDPTRVYVAGLSAGAAAAIILGSAYPDLYAAVGAHSGLACGSAADAPSAFSAMRGGGSPIPRESRARAAPTVVFQGDADQTVHPVNADRVLDQARGGAHLRRTVAQGETAGMAYTRISESDQEGRTILEHWTLHGGGHAWSGGSEAGSYADPRGPDASREMMRFFAGHRTPAR